MLGIIIHFDEMDTLTDDLRLEILQFLTEAEVLLMAQVSKVWNALSSSNLLWKNFFYRRFSQWHRPALNISTLNSNPHSWKKLYLHKRKIDQRWNNAEYKVFMHEAEGANCPTAARFWSEYVITGQIEGWLRVFSIKELLIKGLFIDLKTE